MASGDLILTGEASERADEELPFDLDRDLCLASFTRGRLERSFWSEKLTTFLAQLKLGEDDLELEFEAVPVDFKEESEESELERDDDLDMALAVGAFLAALALVTNFDFTVFNSADVFAWLLVVTPFFSGIVLSFGFLDGWTWSSST